MNIKNSIKSIFRLFGFEVLRQGKTEVDLPDVPQDFTDTYNKVRPYTMTSQERIVALCEAVKYVHRFKIAGDIVECGVWKGGSMMAVADTLMKANDTSRNLYLFDTFEGMPPPTEDDIDIEGNTASSLLQNADESIEESVWCRANLGVVKQALNDTRYPENKVHLVKGLVENTIPDYAPESISLLRLDTDWYESTKHELEHLFPRLVKGGVLIIDDYGHWKGARKAVDEYLEQHNIPILLNRIDYTGRIAIKTD